MREDTRIKNAHGIKRKKKYFQINNTSKLKNNKKVQKKLTNKTNVEWMWVKKEEINEYTEYNLLLSLGCSRLHRK